MSASWRTHVGKMVRYGEGADVVHIEAEVGVDDELHGLALGERDESYECTEDAAGTPVSLVRVPHLSRVSRTVVWLLPKSNQ